MPLTPTVSVDVPTAAFELPVNVSTPLSLPAAPEFTLLSAGVTPFGNPLKVSVVGTLSPPSSVIDTVTEAVPARAIESDVAESASCSAAPCVTCKVTLLAADTPSPVAVTVTVAEPSFAGADAVNVSVLFALPALSVSGLELHVAVTPLGSPLTLRVTAPDKVPFPARVTTSVTLLPCPTASEAEAGVSESVGGVSVTVMGTVDVAVNACPVTDMIWALRPSVDEPATALALPVSVSVHATVPAEVRLGLPHAAVNPLGNPEAMPMLDPAALLATAAPPIGVAVTVTAAVPRDCIETETGEAASVNPADCITCTVTLLVAVSPSPVAVTVSAADCTFAVDAAVSLSVSGFDPKAGMSGFADHAALTPDGRPLTLQVMFPLKDPPVAAVRFTAADAPGATDAVLDAAVTVSDGGTVTVNA